jgi:oligopeptidase B
MIESNEDEYLIPLVIYKPRNIDFPCRTLLIGYGAYGVSVPTHYDSQVSTYLHRGWIVAIAGVRGGGELGKIHHHR